MTGWLTETGKFYDIGNADHKTGLKLISADISPFEAESNWVALRDIKHEEINKILLCGYHPNLGELKRQIKNGANTFTHTLRKKYSDQQLDFLIRHKCFTDPCKI